MFFQDSSNRVQIPYQEDAAPSSGAVNSGDMLFWSNPNVAALASSSNSASFVGVAGGSRSDFQMRIYRGGVFRFKPTAGEVYVARQAVYVGADAQTITNQASGTSIGYVAFDQSSAVNTGRIAVVIEPNL